MQGIVIRKCIDACTTPGHVSVRATGIRRHSSCLLQHWSRYSVSGLWTNAMADPEVGTMGPDPHPWKTTSAIGF